METMNPSEPLSALRAASLDAAAMETLYCPFMRSSGSPWNASLSSSFKICRTWEGFMRAENCSMKNSKVGTIMRSAIWSPRSCIRNCSPPEIRFTPPGVRMSPGFPGF